MPDPMNLQVNILLPQDIARQNTAAQDVLAHQKFAQEMNRSKESETEPVTVQNPTNADEAKLSKDGSGRGKGHLRQKRKHAAGAGEEEVAAAAPADPGKGTRVDFTR